MSQYNLSACILFLCVLLSARNLFAQDTTDLGTSLGDWGTYLPFEDPLGEYYSNEELDEVYKWASGFFLFHEPSSIENLIEVFGKDFYKKSDTDLLEDIKLYFKESIKGDRKSFLEWKPMIEETFKALDNLPNETNFEKNAWDGLINYQVDHTERQRFIDSMRHPIAWKYKIQYDTISFQPKVIDRDNILREIESIEVFLDKYETFMLFITNLYADECWEDFFVSSNYFVNALRDEHLILMYREDTISNLYDINPFALASEQILRIYPDEELSVQELTDPFESGINRLRLQKATWIVTLLKLMATSEQLEGNHSHFVAMCFGTIYALLEGQYSPYLGIVKSLEIQFLNLFSYSNFKDDRYYIRSLELIHEKQNQLNETTRIQELCAEYTVYAAEIYLLDWLYFEINQKEYYEKRKLNAALLLFNSIEYVDKIGQDVIEDCAMCNLNTTALKKKLFMVLYNYFDKIGDEERVLDCLFLILKHIHDYPKYYDREDLEMVLYQIAAIYYGKGKMTESSNYLAYSSQSEFQLLIQGRTTVNLLGGDKLSKESREEQLEEIVSLLKLNDLETDSAESAYSNLDYYEAQLVLYALGDVDEEFFDMGMYLYAYKLLKIKFQLSKIANVKTYDEFINKKEEFYLLTLRAETEHDKKSFEGKVRNLIYDSQDLVSLVNKRTTALKDLDQKLKEKQNILLKYNDSIFLLKDSASRIAQQMDYWKDTSLIIASKNQELDLLRNKEKEAKEKAIKAQEDERNSKENLQLILFVAFILFATTLFLLIVNNRFRKKAIKAKLLSDALRLSIAQISHIARNSLSSFNNRFYKEEDNSETKLDRKEESDFIHHITLFFELFYSNNRKEATHQSIAKEVDFGLLLAKVDYSEDLVNSELSQLVTYSDPTLKTVMVPIYSVVNLVYNAFKHSDRKQPIRIEILGIEYQDYWEIQFSDIGVKSSEPNDSDEKSGTKFMEDMLKIYNAKKSFQEIKRSRDVNKYCVEFKIEKI